MFLRSILIIQKKKYFLPLFICFLCFYTKALRRIRKYKHKNIHWFRGREKKRRTAGRDSAPEWKLQVEIPHPNEDARMDILKIHSRKMNLMRGIDLRKIAKQMNGTNGAEGKAVCTEAGMFALRERRVHVTQDDLQMAVVKVMRKDADANMSQHMLTR